MFEGASLRGVVCLCCYYTGVILPYTVIEYDRHTCTKSDIFIEVIEMLLLSSIIVEHLRSESVMQIIMLTRIIHL